MRFQVFHAQPVRNSRGEVVGIKGGFGLLEANFPADFARVATVECAAMGQVFELTNHIDHPWTENAGVEVEPGVRPDQLRSTSVGDVIVAPDGPYVVALVGFTKLPMTMIVSPALMQI